MNRLRPSARHKGLIDLRQVLLTQGACVKMQFGPCQQVVVARLRQIAARAVELLLSVQGIEVDPLSAQNALPGRDHQRLG